MPLFLISKCIDHPDTHADRYIKKIKDQKGKKEKETAMTELIWRKGHLNGEGLGKENTGSKSE